MRRLIQSSIRLVPWRLRRLIKRMPLFAPLQRLVLAKFLENREFVHTVDAGPAKGLVCPIVLPEDKGVWTGTYELQFVAAMADAVQDSDFCFDVGGWRGYFGGTMAVRGARRVVIFEPLQDNCERIRRLMDLNPSLPIQLVEAAAGKASGTAKFTIMPATSMGKLASSEFQAGMSSEEQITVPVVSLDDWCAQTGNPFPNIVKIDVEGAELQVLEGAAKILKTARPTLFIEAHTRTLASGVAALLNQSHYRVTTLETGRPPDGKTEPEVCHLSAAFDK
jgi:FkbM family methyltransferase